jgi:hypothetical protein
MENIINFDKFLNEAYIGPDSKMYGQSSDSYQSILMDLENLKNSSNGEAPLDDLLDLMTRALKILAPRDISSLYSKMKNIFSEVEIVEGTVRAAINTPNTEEGRRAAKCIQIAKLVRDGIKSL